MPRTHLCSASLTTNTVNFVSAKHEGVNAMELSDYVRELKNVKLLERDEEQALWCAFKDEDDQEARQRLIEAYQPLVFKEAAPYSTNDNVMDMVQEGTVGLIEAAEKYDYKKGVAFSLYAAHRIRGRILNFIAKETNAPSPCMDEITDNGMTFAECLEDSSPSVAEIAESRQLAEKLRDALDRLPTKERAVLQDIYFTNREIKAVADDLDVTAAHIYRLQKKGIRRVRGMLAKFMHYW